MLGSTQTKRPSGCLLGLEHCILSLIIVHFVSLKVRGPESIGDVRRHHDRLLLRGVLLLLPHSIVSLYEGFSRPQERRDQEVSVE